MIFVWIIDHQSELFLKFILTFLLWLLDCLCWLCGQQSCSAHVVHHYSWNFLTLETTVGSFIITYLILFPWIITNLQLGCHWFPATCPWLTLRLSQETCPTPCSVKWDKILLPSWGLYCFWSCFACLQYTTTKSKGYAGWMTTIVLWSQSKICQQKLLSRI